MKLQIELGGGLELLFDKKKDHNVEVPNTAKERDGRLKMRDLLAWMKTNLLKERPELFLVDDSVRPGILVLVNDVDWDLLDTLDYELNEKDHVVFISTLHGG